jgi:SAM-dependent MidA family methyltransferase
MTELGLTNQAYFLAGLGIEQVLVEMQGVVNAQDYVTARHAVMHLIDPRGLGRFRVLLLGKNVDISRTLSGLSFTL